MELRPKKIRRPSAIHVHFFIVIALIVIALTFSLQSFGTTVVSSISTGSTRETATTTTVAISSNTSAASAFPLNSSTGAGASLRAIAIPPSESTTISSTTSSTSTISSSNNITASSNETINWSSSYPPIAKRVITKVLEKSPPPGIIVPLYTQPTDGSWSQLISVKSAHPHVPIIAIINPASGPGSGPSEQWASGIDSLRAAGIKVVGYVATGYGYIYLSDVESQIQDYSSWYHVDGIFFDEMANSNGSGTCPSACTLQQYYSDLVSYAGNLGYKLTIGNPGSSTDPSFNKIMSILVIYENSGSAAISSVQSSTAAYGNKTAFGVIDIGVPMNSTLETSYSSYVGWIYMTDYCTGVSVSVCNPYDGLPSYFSTLVANLDG